MGFLSDVFGGKPPKFSSQRVPTSQEADDVLEAVRKIGEFNAGQGADAAIEVAGKSNRAATDDVIAALDSFFGGRGPKIRDNIAEGLEARSRGQLSAGTKRLLGARAAEQGAALGETAVDNAFTLSVGLTSEQVQSSAAQEYRSLYATYRQSVPITSPAQVLDFGGVNTGTALQASIQGASLQLNRDQFAHKAAVTRSQTPSTFSNIVGFGLGVLGAATGPGGGVAGAIAQRGLVGGIGASVRAATKGFGASGLSTSPPG